MASQKVVTAQCPACCSATVSVREAFYGRSGVVRCSSCRTEALHPQPTDQRLAEIYGDDYYAIWGLEADPSVEAMKQSTFDWILGRHRLSAGAQILDLGCATGFLLALAKQRGVVPFGIDLNPVAIESCRRTVPGASVHLGTLADEPFPGVSFDAVYMVDVLEHVRNPRAELSLIRRRLVPRGVVVISSPSIDSLSRKLMGWRWIQYREEHLTYFSREGLVRLLHDTGFETIDTRSTRKTITLGYAYRHLQKYPHPLLTPVSSVLWRCLPLARSIRCPFNLGEVTVVARAT